MATAIEPGFDIPFPAAGNSAVVFMRPGPLTEAYDYVSAVVFDGQEMVGALKEATYVVHETPPGTHRFMVLSEAADFLDANLVADRVYFVRVRPRMGVWRTRFSLLPVRPNVSNREKVREFLATARRAVLNDVGRTWAADNATSIAEKRDEYQKTWLEKPAAERPLLRPIDGIDQEALSTLRD